jgi:hypothetical protein
VKRFAFSILCLGLVIMLTTFGCSNTGGGQGADAGNPILLGAGTRVSVGATDASLPVRGSVSLKAGMITVEATNSSGSSKEINLQVKEGSSYSTVFRTTIGPSMTITLNTFMRIYTATSVFILKDAANDGSVSVFVTDQLWINVD